MALKLLNVMEIPEILDRISGRIKSEGKRRVHILPSLGWTGSHHERTASGSSVRVSGDAASNTWRDTLLAALS